MPDDEVLRHPEAGEEPVDDEQATAVRPAVTDAVFTHAVHTDAEPVVVPTGESESGHRSEPERASGEEGEPDFGPETEEEPEHEPAPETETQPTARPKLAAGGVEDIGAAGDTDGPAHPGRTLRDWLRPDLSQTVIAILLAAFSFAVVTQIRARDEVDSYSTLRQSDLVGMLDGLNQESDRLQSELDSLKQSQAELQSGQDSEALAKAQAEDRLTSLGILAGTVPARGPGITLTITDPQGKVKPGTLLDAVEEMRDAGAEAIQVNGTIRIVASSWISSGPSGIIIDGQAVSTPITMEVIGDPHSLEEAARFRGGLVSQITDSRVGGHVSIARSDDLKITSLHRQQEPRYARPDTSAEKPAGATGD